MRTARFPWNVESKQQLYIELLKYLKDEVKISFENTGIKIKELVLDCLEVVEVF